MFCLVAPDTEPCNLSCMAPNYAEQLLGDLSGAAGLHPSLLGVCSSHAHPSGGCATPEPRDSVPFLSRVLTECATPLVDNLKPRLRVQTACMSMYALAELELLG